MRAENWEGLPKREPKGRRPRGKASPEAVIGKSKPMGRLNKRLILGVAGALGIGLLVFNFLPGEKASKQGSSDGSPVYANDTMPQDVKEMALKMPEASTTVGAATSSSGYQRPANVGNPFVGYQGTTGGSTSSSRATGADSTNVASRDYQGMQRRGGENRSGGRRPASADGSGHQADSRAYDRRIGTDQ